MKGKTLLAVFVLFSLTIATRAFTEETTNKYQDIFYPDGMHKYENAAVDVYELYDELDIPNSNLKVVVFSLELAEDGVFDTHHTVYISVLQSNNGTFSVKYQNKITDYLKLSFEEVPGYFMYMDANLNFFEISDDINAVHLNMSNVLSGSGGISSKSDIFFLIKNNELVPVLELTYTGSSARAGIGYSSASDTYFYIADTDSDGSMDIISQDYSYKQDDYEGIYIDELSKELNVYKFDRNENKYKLSGQITSLPENAEKL